MHLRPDPLLLHTPAHTISTHLISTRPAPSSYMFGGAAAFDQPLNDWDVSQVTDMRYVTDDREPHTTTYRCRHSKPNP